MVQYAVQYISAVRKAGCIDPSIHTHHTAYIVPSVHTSNTGRKNPAICANHNVSFDPLSVLVIIAKKPLSMLNVRPKKTPTSMP
jgi:hypothetical protein